MRGCWVLSVLALGCGESEQTPEQEYRALEARVTTDCGLYEKNYPPPPDPPQYLCGARPNIECVNDAIGGASVARLRYSFLSIRLGLMHEEDYYAVDDKLVFIRYSEVGLDDPAWFRHDCERLELESYDVAGMTCWKFAPTACVVR